MKVLVYRVGKEPILEDVKNELEILQSLVGGCIECLDLRGCKNVPYLLICNEEGKLNGSPQNRPVYQDGYVDTVERIGKASDIIYGDFFICKDAGEDFDGLDEKDITDIYDNEFIGGIIG